MTNRDKMSIEGASQQLSLARPGPRTPQGKRRSSQNARRHRILEDILRRDGCLGDSQSDFSKLLVGLRKDFGPTGSIENLLVEKLAVLFLRLSRVYKADLTVAPQLFTKVQAGLLGDESLVVTKPLHFYDWSERAAHCSSCQVIIERGLARVNAK